MAHHVKTPRLTTPAKLNSARLFPSSCSHHVHNETSRHSCKKDKDAHHDNTTENKSPHANIASSFGAVDTSRLRAWSFSKSPPHSPLTAASATFGTSPPQPQGPHVHGRRPSISSALTTALQQQRDANNSPSSSQGSFTPTTPPLTWTGFIPPPNSLASNASPPHSPTKRRWSQPATALMFPNRQLLNQNQSTAVPSTLQSKSSSPQKAAPLPSSPPPPPRPVSPSRERFLSGQLLD